MGSFSRHIATVDFEATALSKSADTIEVGVAIFDRHETIRTWSSLVRPGPNCLWSAQSAEIHKISRLDLEAAPEPSEVAATFNRLMSGALTAYCDGREYDHAWMEDLFCRAQILPAFSLADIEEMPRVHVDNIHRQMNEFLSRTMIVHRAGEDALRLMQAYCYAIGKKPAVIAVG